MNIKITFSLVNICILTLCRVATQFSCQISTPKFFPDKQNQKKTLNQTKIDMVTISHQISLRIYYLNPDSVSNPEL